MIKRLVCLVVGHRRGAVRYRYGFQNWIYVCTRCGGDIT